MPLSVAPLSYWRVAAAPAWPRVVGQGEMPSGPAVDVRAADGSVHRVALRWGQLLRASANCDPDRDVATLGARPTPLVRCAVLAQLAEAGLVEPVEPAPAPA